MLKGKVKKTIDTYDNKNKDKRFVVSIEQLADIVSYCVNMTLFGAGHSKDWTTNVETAIGLNGVGYRMDKIILEEITPKSDLCGDRAIRNC